MHLSLLSLFLLAVFSVAVPTVLLSDDALRVKESIPAPYGWTRISRAPSDLDIRLRIALFQQDFVGLERQLYEISDPDHPRYGAHMSKEEVEAFVAPSAASLALVDAWLAAFGITEDKLERSPAKDWVSVTVSMSLAERILGAEYYMWQHTGGDVLVRTTNYSLPQHLHDHIELVQPTTMFARPKGPSPLIYHNEVASESESIEPVTAPTPPGVDPACGTHITLSCIMQLYGAHGYEPRATKKNAIGITGFLDQYANKRDLTSFYREQLPEAENSTFKLVLVHGGENNQTLSVAGPEANLDTQFAFGISYPTPGTFWSTGGRPPFKADNHTPINTNEPYLDWLDYILRSEHIPQTISTSYADDEQTVPFSYASRVCKRFAELGCRGVSLLFASGDGGIGDGNPDPATHQCFANGGKHRTRFVPAFPASCPYVTSVGGTGGIPEVSANFSGGGFSDHFPRPQYQDEAVKGYLDKLHGHTYDGLFDRAGRGIPDVSAQSRKFQIYWRGARISIGGTSAATPTFAGLVALLNDARLGAGRRPLGFLNPLLYKRDSSRGLTDITVGSNPGCGTSGFNATEGWDPVTGLGTPNFWELLKIVA